MGADPRTEWVWDAVKSGDLELVKAAPSDFNFGSTHSTHGTALTAFVVEYVSAEVAEMNDGKLVERGEAGENFANPQHEYTKTLLEAVPKKPEPPAGMPTVLSSCYLISAACCSISDTWAPSAR